MSILKTHNLQSPDSGSANIALTPNVGMVVAGISTFNNKILLGTSDAGYPNYADNLTVSGTGNEGITIRSGATSQGAIYFSDTTGTAAGTYVGNIIYDHSDNHMRFATSSLERLRIASDGKILIGSTTARNISGSSATSGLQLEATNVSDSSLALITNVASTSSAILRFGKTRGTSTGAVTTVANGDTLGRISFSGADGTDVANNTAQIKVVVNGTVAGNQIPTDITFETSATDGSSRAERLRITSAGLVGINHNTSGASTNAPLTIKNSTSSTATRFNLVNQGSSSVESTQIYSQNNDLAFVAGAQEAFRVKDTGQVVFYGGDTNTDAIRVESEGGGAALHISNFQGVTDTGDTTRLGVGKNDNVLLFTNASSSQISHFAIGNTDSVPLVFSTNNTERFRIAGGGQFGIAGANYGTSGQVLTSGGSSGAPSWSGGAQRILEIVTSVCDGSTISSSNGNVTFPNVTAVQNLSTTFADIAGSIISYEPPTGTTQVIYEFQFQMSRQDALSISHYQLYLDSNEVTKARSEMAGEDISARTSFKWVFNIGGSADTTVGRVASWSSAKTMKWRAEDYSGSHDVQLHETNWWDGGGTDQFSMPMITLTAIGV